MKYVAKHLTRHHLFHAPHRWFFALLLSPIHAAEVHYQKRYHLQFAHARKLFLFDLCLVAAIFGLTGLTAYWFWYDPTITEKIALSVRASADTTNTEVGRIRSGEKITFAINYQNNSDQELNAAELRVRLPQHFILENATGANFITSTQTFLIGRVLRNTNATVYASGIFYGVPTTDEHVVAELHYIPNQRSRPESKLAALITNLRDSVLETQLELPPRLPARSATPAKLTLHNNHNYPLPEILLPLPTGAISAANAHSTMGKITNEGWRLPSLGPSETATLEFLLNTNLGAQFTTASVRLTPFIFPNGVSIAQQVLEKNWTVARPEISLISTWENKAAAPGSNQKLNVVIRNRGSETVQNIRLTIPLSTNVIDSARWLNAGNVGRINNGVVTITRAHDVRLTELAPGAEIFVPLIIPIKNFPNGAANFKINIPMRLHAQIVDLTSEFETEANAPELQLGTALRVSAEARYYTADGDQLGRGPLPPQVGKATKYALLLRVVNATAQADAVRLTATLPTNVVWTGKTSVSRGQEINYDANTRRLSWSSAQFPALAELSVFIEVGITPTESDRGRTVPLLQNIIVEGIDSVLESPLRATAPALNSSLGTDSVAKTIGTTVR